MIDLIINYKHLKPFLETKKGKTRKKSILHACPFYCNSYYLRILGVDLHTSTLHQTFPALQAFKTFLETPPIDKDAVKDFVEQNKIGGKSMYFMHALSTVILIIYTSWASVYTGTAEVIGSRLVFFKILVSGLLTFVV